MLSEEDLYVKNDSDKNKHIGLLRLLEVDNKVFLPVNNHIRILVTAADVLHS